LSLGAGTRMEMYTIGGQTPKTRTKKPIAMVYSLRSGTVTAQMSQSKFVSWRQTFYLTFKPWYLSIMTTIEQQCIWNWSTPPFPYNPPQTKPITWRLPSHTTQLPESPSASWRGRRISTSPRCRWKGGEWWNFLATIFQVLEKERKMERKR